MIRALRGSDDVAQEQTKGVDQPIGTVPDDARAHRDSSLLMTGHTLIVLEGT